MAKKQSPEFQPYVKAQCTPLDISRLLNFPGGGPRGRFWTILKEICQEFPVGAQKPWGIPFRMAPGGSRARAIMLRAGDTVQVRVGVKADVLCVLHTFRQADDDPTRYVEATPVGEYELLYTDGSSHRQPIRARLDVPVATSPGPAQMAVSFTMPRATDPTAHPFIVRVPTGEPVRQASNWGFLQCGFTGGGAAEPLLYAIRNPHPRKEIAALVVRGLVASPLLVAGVTAYRGSDHPLRHLARRMYRVRSRTRGAVQVKDLAVDLGAVARVDHTIGPRGKAWLQSPYAGLVQGDEPARDPEDVFSIYGARDASVTVTLADRKEPVALSLGEAYETGVAALGDIQLERLGGGKQWVQVEIVDAGTGQPTPARLHIAGPAGEYIAPHGHHEQINANWFEDYGADVKVANRSFAYVPGVFTTDLPTGDLYIEIDKGFEYEPVRRKIALRPGQKRITLPIRRWQDLRSQGWVTADTHVHFISPHTAWLQAQCEGVNVVNLLASQWGRLFTNVGDITGRVGVVENDTIVWVGTENRNHMLGHISMLGTKGLPVFPMCCGGVGEAWLGDPDYRSLTDWAAECKQKDGVVIRPHFPYCGFTEDPALAVSGLVDALEIRVGPQADFPLQEWYGYLNNGYRVAVAGGTDKMSAATALGALRTYAQIDPNRPFTFAAWAKAVRAGRTFATTGPLIDMRVEGASIGDTIRLPAGGGRLEVEATAASAWPLGRIELVQNGRVVASESVRGGARRLKVCAKLPFAGSGWVAARCTGAQRSPAGYMMAHTSPVYVARGSEQPYDGPALEHMLNLTRGGIEYLETIATQFSKKDHERIIRVYRHAEQHLAGRLHNH